MTEDALRALAYRVASINCESIGLLDEEIRQHPDALDDTIAILKEIWNARGAADRRALADLLIAQPSNISEPVQYAIKKLDRREEQE